MFLRVAVDQVLRNALPDAVDVVVAVLVVEEDEVLQKLIALEVEQVRRAFQHLEANLPVLVLAQNLELRDDPLLDDLAVEVRVEEVEVADGRELHFDDAVFEHREQDLQQVLLDELLGDVLHRSAQHIDHGVAHVVRLVLGERRLPAAAL